MIDFRYHALSLIAVLVALVIGVLLGVAIGDEGLVSSAERALRADIQERVEQARDETDAAEERLARRNLYEERTFATLVGSLLRGKRVAVVFLHDDTREAFEPVRQALEASGAELASVSTLRDPLDVEALAGAAQGTRFEELTADDEELIDAFARRLGSQMVGGGRLLRAVRRELLTSSSGTLDGAGAVVLVRAEPSGDLPDVTGPFVDAFVEGMSAFETPVVGVERSSTDPSQIDWYEDHGLASVDNIDEPAGRASLVYALAGVADGAYGFKDTADALVPEALSGE